MSRRLAFLAGALSLALAPSAHARDYAGSALNIVPSGQLGSFPVPADADRQAKMYDALTPRFDQVTAADIAKDFKSERFGVGPDGPGKVEKLPRTGVRVVRDRFHVPHISATSRDALTWAAGWVIAEDRGLLLQQARYPARVAALDVPNIPALGLIVGLKSFTPSAQTERELARQTTALRKAGPLGLRVLHDIDVYVKGINAYLKSTKSPNAPWTRNDVYALNAFKGQFLGQGGGSEAIRSAFLSGLQGRFGEAQGQTIFDDLRQRDLPDQPTSIPGRFPYGTVPASKAGNVPIDHGSVQQVVLTPPEPTATASSVARPVGAYASNVLMVGAKRSATHHPLMVGGPQIGYFYPGLTLEMELQAPGVHSRGVTSAPFPGYMLIGRGEDFAWTLTSANGDIVDQFAETLCGDDTHYMFKGQCRAMETVDAGKLGDTELVYQRTVHGPVVAYATTGGRRVAIASQRASYGRDTVDQIPFLQLTDGTVRSPKTFIQAFLKTPQTFNAYYLDDRHIAEITTGDLPLRAPDVDPGLPTDGTGGHEWRGFLSAKGHPQAIDPKSGEIVNWNNRVAHGFQAADNEWTTGGAQRVDLLKAGVAARRTHSIVSLTAAMNKAATQDVRAIRLQPVLSAVLRTGAAPSDRDARMLDLLDAWTKAGGSRLDRDLDGKVDDPGAAIMDTVSDRLGNAALAPVLGDQLDELATLHKRWDKPPASNMYSGWYQYLYEDLNAVLGKPLPGAYRTRFCGAGDLAACRDALWGALHAAGDELEAAQGTDPAAWRSDANAERITFKPGLLTTTLRYTNRPNGIQQLIWFRGHRPAR